MEQGIYDNQVQKKIKGNIKPIGKHLNQIKTTVLFLLPRKLKLTLK